jgi:cytochrome b involved in lipid metabolism
MNLEHIKAHPLGNDTSVAANRFLIIPCNAAGMGSLLKGAISGLLFAEFTGRAPLIYWHQNCNYLKTAASPYHNAFHDYYQYTCPFSLEDAFKQSTSTYPQGTRIENLHALLDELHRTLSDSEEYFGNICSNQASKADLVVFPTYISMERILEAIPSDHRFHKMEEKALTQWVAEKFLIVKEDISEQVNHFWTQHFADTEKVVTVHIRVGDKYRDSILPSFSRYKHQVDTFLQNHPGGKIYLATDSSHAVNFFERRYADQVVTSPALRSSGRKGVHKTGADGLQIGNEILFDVECLSRGNHFVGFDKSNVFFWVRHLTRAGINQSFSHISVRSGMREILLNRQSLKRAIKKAWRSLFSSSNESA